LARSERQPLVDVVGGIELGSPGGIDLQLAAAGSEISVIVHSVPDMIRLGREAPRRGTRAQLFERLQKLSRSSGLSFRVRVGQRSVGRLDSSSRGSWLARLLRMGPVDISLRDLLAATLLISGRRND